MNSDIDNLNNINVKIKILNKKKLAKILIIGSFSLVSFMTINEAKENPSERTIKNAEYLGVATLTSIAYCSHEIVDCETEIKSLVKQKKLILKK